MSLIWFDLIVVLKGDGVSCLSYLKHSAPFSLVDFEFNLYACSHAVLF